MPPLPTITKEQISNGDLLEESDYDLAIMVNMYILYDLPTQFNPMVPYKMRIINNSVFDVITLARFYFLKCEHGKSLCTNFYILHKILVHFHVSMHCITH